MVRHSDQHVSLHAAGLADGVTLCAAIAMPADALGAPEWVHLLPAGEIRTGDGRGPYRVREASELLATSLQAGDRLPIDENHSTDLAAPRGEPAPARGWIVELQSRQDGVWGRVEWTDDGRKLVEGRAYRGLSPVIQHQADGRITAILRASLVNRPNLRGLTALHQENDMDLLAKLLAALGLPAATTEDAAITAVTTLHAERANGATALQAVLDPIATTVGLAAGADAAAVLLGVQAVAATAAGKTGSGDVVAALQAELKTVATELTTLKDAGAKKAAEAFVDTEIKRGRVGVKPLRDHYVAMHMADPARVEKEIGAMPVLGSGGQIAVPAAPPANGEVALQSEDRQTARLLGIAEKDFAATLKDERKAGL